jgi:hypothetical protein
VKHHLCMFVCGMATIVTNFLMLWCGNQYILVQVIAHTVLKIYSSSWWIFCFHILFPFSVLIIQWNFYLSFPDNSFSRICRSISMVPEWILFQLWLPHLLFSRIHCFFFRPLTKTMNRGFTVLRMLGVICIYY